MIIMCLAIFMVNECTAIELAKLLCNTFGAVDYSLQWSETPVMFAEWKGHLLIVKRFVEHGGDVFHKARMGQAQWWVPTIRVND